VIIYTVIQPELNSNQYTAHIPDQIMKQGDANFTRHQMHKIWIL